MNQMDGGANTSISDDLSIFTSFWPIPDYNINGIASDAKVICTHRGIYHMPTDTGDHIPILMYFSLQESRIVVSPTDAVIQNIDYLCWLHFADIANKKGYIKFMSESI